MTHNVHFYDGSVSTSSCTVFHIGNERLLTAAHCFEEIYLFLAVEGMMDDYWKKHFNVTVIDSHGHEYKDIEIIKFNIENDLVFMKVNRFHGSSLQIWNPVIDGEPKVGSEIVALGYPGYFGRKFTYEQGLIKQIGRLETGLGADGPFIMSKSTLYPGYSGGPTLASSNGKVIGLNHAGANIPAFAGVVISLSLAISYETINRFLEDSGKGNRLAGTEMSVKY